MVEGASRRDIADRLKVGLRTVVARRISLMRKLGLKGRGALLRYALHRGVTRPSTGRGGCEDSQQRRSSDARGHARPPRALSLKTTERQEWQQLDAGRER